MHLRAGLLLCGFHALVMNAGGGASLNATVVCSNLPDQIEAAYGDVGDNCVAEARVDCHPCPADPDADGVVNGRDLGWLFSQWGPCGPGWMADRLNDGVVNAEGPGLLFVAWGRCH